MYMRIHALEIDEARLWVYVRIGEWGFYNWPSAATVIALAPVCEITFRPIHKSGIASIPYFPIISRRSRKLLYRSEARQHLELIRFFASVFFLVVYASMKVMVRPVLAPVYSRVTRCGSRRCVR